MWLAFWRKQKLVQGSQQVTCIPPCNWLMPSGTDRGDAAWRASLPVLVAAISGPLSRADME